MLTWLRKYEGSRLAVAGLCVAVVLFLAVNVLSGTVLGNARLDLTRGGLFTLSEGTRKVLSGLEEPVQVRLYYSPGLGDVAPQFAAYYGRVRELLQQFEALSDGKLQLELLEPTPFSDVEDRAVADGLQGAPINQTGEQGYFGLAGSNSTDGRAGIPFFSPDREPFLEYDLAKLVYGLGRGERPVLGLISALPSDPGGRGVPGGPPSLAIFDQMREFFTVEDLDLDVVEIPANIETLMVVDLGRLGAPTLRAIDRFVHRGGRAIVFVDPMVESGAAGGPVQTEPAPKEELDRLLRGWGLTVVDDKVAGDIDFARRVSTGGEQGQVVADYVAWLSLGRDNVDAADPVMANVERLNIATAGILEPVEGSGLTVTPLISTGPRAMPIGAAGLRHFPDIVGLLRNYQPGGKPLILAARVSGEAPLAFAGAPPPQAPDGGGPVPATPAPSPDDSERKPIQLIVVADADMLYDRFWVQRSDFLGEQVDVPTASNGDFVINSLENLTDTGALIGLRGRGTSYRPFTMVEDLRREAEARFRTKEQELQTRLKDLQAQLDGLQQREGPGGEIKLSADDKAAIERFRGEMLTVRKELRDVQLALRSDIEQLEQRVKFANIAAVPLLLVAIGAVVGVARWVRRSRSKRRSAGS